MSASKKFRPFELLPEESSTKPEGTRQQGNTQLAKDGIAIKASLKERARLMLEYPANQAIDVETDLLQMQTEESISDLYRSLSDQSIRTSQMCMDAELRAIAAIEERITAELRLIEADYSCIGMEVRARKALADQLQEAVAAVASARARENAVMNELDTAKPDPGTGARKLDQQQKLAQKRLSAESRTLKMQRIRMDAEQCAIQEIESLVVQDDLMAFDAPQQHLSEEFILQMALENAMLATQDNAYAATGIDGQAHKIEAEAGVDRLLDNIRNTSWRNFVIESTTLH